MHCTHALKSLGVHAQSHVLHARLAEELVLEQEAGHFGRRHIVRGRTRPALALVGGLALLKVHDLGQRAANVQAKAVAQVGAGDSKSDRISHTDDAHSTAALTPWRSS